MKSAKKSLIVASLGVAALVAVPLCWSQVGSGRGLSGNVKGLDGKPLEGIIVSAQAEGRTITTNVYTDKDGNYWFPPLASGKYKVWAQAVGFETASTDLELSGKPLLHNLTMKPLKDFSSQLSGEEWLASLPEGNHEQRREKALFVNNCTACHQAGFPLQNRFDSKGWGNIVDLMSKTGGLGAYQGGRVAFPIIQEYKDQFVSFLTRVRGPDSPPIKFKVAPRTQGEGTRAVITEYNLTTGEAPEYFPIHNGSDWELGTPSAYEGRSAHDLAVDAEGNVWFTDQASPDRTIGKVDTKTGKVSGWKLPVQNNVGGSASEDGFIETGRTGQAAGSHGMAIDASGGVWFTNLTEGTMTKFDPKTEKFVRYSRPAELASAGGNYLQFDSKGNAWTNSRRGVAKLDPTTGKYTEYQTITPGGDYYGLAIDSEDKVWIAQTGKDLVGIIDSRTGEVSEIKMPVSELDFTNKDLEVASKYKERSGNISAWPQVKGPRRLAADPKGNSVWIAEYFADKIAKVDMHTKKITEYPLPRPYMQPYHIAVDKNHMVWICTFTDRVLKFDPTTERFTEYALPTRGTEMRFIVVDDRTTPPTVWLPYWRANKIAKMEFRTATQASR